MRLGHKCKDKLMDSLVHDLDETIEYFAIKF